MERSAPGSVKVTPIHLENGPGIPNHSRWSLLVYRHAVPADAQEVEKRLESNGWGGSWRDGVFDYHHYHTTSHEVLAA